MGSKAHQVYIADGKTGEILSQIASRLDEVIADESERQEAVRELTRCGRYWTGGGAAPLLFLFWAN